MTEYKSQKVFNQKSWRVKSLHLGLVLSSLIAYFEWGKDQHSYLFEIEIQIFQKLFTETSTVFHPFILIPLAAQLVLLFTVFQQKPSKILGLFGLLGMGILLVLVFIIGIYSSHWGSVLSILPFVVLSTLYLVYFKKL